MRDRQRLIEKLRKLASESPHEGERKAAQFALDRLGASKDPSLFEIMPTVRGRMGHATTDERNLAIAAAIWLGLQPQRMQVTGKRRKPRWDQAVYVAGERPIVETCIALYANLRAELRRTLKWAACGFVDGVFPPPPPKPGVKPIVKRLNASEFRAAMFGREVGATLSPRQLLPLAEKR